MRVYSEKDLKRIAKEMQGGMKELDRMAKPAPLTAAEAKELRRLQQAERRANKALLEVVL
jgi:hypothetical protein